jgi:hypothetical protein
MDIHCNRNSWFGRIFFKHRSFQELSLAASAETSGDWRRDWNKFVLKALDDDEPCYLLYRLTPYIYLYLELGP